MPEDGAQVHVTVGRTWVDCLEFPGFWLWMRAWQSRNATLSLCQQKALDVLMFVWCYQRMPRCLKRQHERLHHSRTPVELENPKEKNGDFHSTQKVGMLSPHRWPPLMGSHWPPSKISWLGGFTVSNEARAVAVASGLWSKSCWLHVPLLEKVYSFVPRHYHRWKTCKQNPKNGAMRWRGWTDTEFLVHKNG